MSKMFVHYNGTVEAFKAAGLETTYNKHIVFIKGGADGTGQAIYTHGEYYGNLNEALAALEAKVNGLKYFSQITDGTNTAKSAIADGTITFSAVDPASVTVEVDARGVSFGLSDAFVKKVNEDLPGAINTEKSRAEGVEAEIKALVGTKKDQAATGDDASAFARIANLESTVSDLTGGSVESVGAQISNAINALDVDSVGSDFIKSISQDNGKIVPVAGTFTEAGVAMKSYVDEQVVELGGGIQALGNNLNQQLAEKATKLELSGVQSGIAQQMENITNTVANNDTEVRKDFAAADAQTLQSAKSYADSLFGADSDFADLEGRVAANEDAIEVLNGAEGLTGSVANTVAKAINDWAEKVSPENTTVDTFKELIDYAATHGSEYSTLAGVVQGHTTAIETLNGEGAGSVAKTVADAVADEAVFRQNADTALGQRIDAIVAEGTGTIDAKVAAAVNAEKERAMEAEKANSEAISGVEGRVADIEKDYLKAADKTELSGKISALEGVAGAGQIAAAQAAADAAQDTADGAVVTANANKAAIEAMDLAEVSGYVKSIKQEDGKVSATAVANIPASDVTVADTADNFTGTNVESVLAELAAMWAWEEINA